MSVSTRRERSLIRGGRLLLAMGVVTFGLAGALSAQEENPLPDGWQELSAAELLEAAEPVFAAANAVVLAGQLPPDTTQAEAVAVHAWETFLESDAQSSGLSRPVLTQWMQYLQPHSEWLVADGRPLEQVHARWDALADAVLESYQQDLAAGTDISLVELGAWEWSVADEPAGSQRRQLWDSLVSGWMDQNDFSELPNADLWVLLEQLDDELVNPQAFSVRWTGTLSAPASGSYRFEQLRNWSGNGELRVWLDGNLVLDTTAAAGRSNAAEDYRSQPMSLTAGEPVPFRAEYVFDQSRHQLNQGTFYLYPMAVLYWDSGSGFEIIPQSAYGPPEGFGGGATQGLQAEYFADTALGEAVQTRLDSGVGQIWSTVVAPAEYEEYRQVLAEAYRRSTVLDENDPHPNARLSDDFMEFYVTRLPQRVDAWGGLDLMQRLADSDALLAPPYYWWSALEDIWRWQGMLAGPTRVHLLDRWYGGRPEAQAKIYDQFQPLAYFYGSNFEFDWLSVWFRNPDDADLQVLIEEHLEHADGRCRIGILNTVTYTLQHLGRGREMRDLVVGRLSELPPTGDVTASWLIGRAWVTEVLSGRPPRPNLALPYLEDAYLAASGDAAKFRALDEILVRLVCLERFDEAEARIAAARERFTEQQHQDRLDAIQAESEVFATRMAQWHVDRAEVVRREQRAAQVARLQERVDRAQARGDTATASRYQQRINDLQQLLQAE